eukprot:CAMPEP_0204345862 /NCGR_PEP_ID=MMETSP0469-20131031/26723_1 /ASSEMBLY_ACC=CAM_ASM_000384 /TAXON_ID=2969 /ORGANISM="Oxyrrhis marina" /LENGTH=112 /DNA_ID=CAMNT_0051331375 /DNA_START=68 /DNA_END=406 /DNA_ORIENTATION=-
MGELPFGASEQPATKRRRQVEVVSPVGPAFSVPLSIQASMSQSPQAMCHEVQFYKHLANGGCALAQFRMGLAYEQGSGVGRDLRTAAEWYSLSAAQGFAHASQRLAAIHQQI